MITCPCSFAQVFGAVFTSLALLLLLKLAGEMIGTIILALLQRRR